MFGVLALVSFFWLHFIYEFINASAGRQAMTFFSHHSLMWGFSFYSASHHFTPLHTSSPRITSHHTTSLLSIHISLFYCLSVLTVYYTLHYSCYYQRFLLKKMMNTGDLTAGIDSTLWRFIRETHFLQSLVFKFVVDFF